MGFRQNLKILIIDDIGWRASSVKSGLELLGPEYQIGIKQSEVEALTSCFDTKIMVFIIAPEHMQSAFLIRNLCEVQKNKLIILMVPPAIEEEMKERYRQESDILILVQPCSFKTIHKVIQEWLYGKKISVLKNTGGAILKCWGFTVKYLGYDYMCDALLEYALEPRQTLKSIYLSLEAYRQNSARNIQSAMRTAVKNAWKTGKMSSDFEHLPNNKEILMTLYQKVDESI